MSGSSGDTPMRSFLLLILIALRRLWATRWLAFGALVALVAAVALAVAVPVYAEAASLRLLREELARQEQRSGRPAFALLIRYLGAWAEPLEWEQVAPADDAVRAAVEHLGLPLVGLAGHARTAPMPLAEPGGRPLLDVAIGFVTGMDGLIQIIDGAAPRPAQDLAAPVEVLISRTLADRVGLNVGDELTAIGANAGRQVGIPVRIAGIWEPLDPGGPAWFFAPDAFDELLLVDEASFAGPLAGALSDEVAQVLWFARLDGAGLDAASAGALAGRIEALRAATAAALPGVRLEQSPEAAIGSYRRANAALTAQLIVFSAPVLGLVVIFIALVGGLAAQGRAPEIALLKTRGIRDRQILAMIAAEWLLLGGAALLAGPPLGLWLAAVMARTSSFLRLDPGLPELALALTPRHVSFGLGAAAVGLLAALAPAAAATRRTLADAQRAASRPPRAPLWRRAGLDLLLLPAPIYGVYQLHSGALPGGGSGRDLTANPLIILIPALLSLSLGLLTLRLLPPLLERAARVAARPGWVAPLVALRALARQPGSYSGPLLLLALTLSLAIFSAAAAATLDEALRRSATYRIGAAAQLIETGESTEQDSDGSGVPERRNIEEEARFLFVPVGDHLEVPGVLAASRVGRYEGRLALGGRSSTAQLVGVDRLTLPQVLRGFDPAWAGGASLGELMNRLAVEPAGALVSSDVLAKGLAIGDRLTVQAELYGDRRKVELVIVGAVELFPGLYPQDGPLVIVNLDHLFDQMGGQYPYDVWIDYDPDAEIEAIAAGVRRLGVDLVEVRDAAALIRAEQSRPERQGLFGLLSIGFIAAGALTVLGFLIATSLTARRRALELGVLRAIGMAERGATASLAIEQGSIMACGLVAGGAIGVLCALLIVPSLQGGVAPYPGTPPTAPRLAWVEMGLAAALLVAAVLLALLGLALALRRTSLFSVVKLGDAN